MTKILAIALSLAMLLCCSTALADTTITVYAATSLTATLTQLEAMYEAENPGVDVVCNFGSSGTLLKQIQAGDACDIFISAAQKQMNTLEEEGTIDSATRFDLLENKLVLAVSQENDDGITSIAQVIERLKNGNILIAMGNSDVPCGQYTKALFHFFGVDETAAADKLSYGNNAGEVAQQVRAASVSCGFVYQTDACSYGLLVVEEATEEMVGGRVLYPAAVLNHAEDADACAAFLEYLRSEEAARVFASVGFTQL